MGLESRMAEELIRSRPERAAAVLESLGVEAAAALLARQEGAPAGAVLGAMAPHAAGALLGALPPKRAAECLEALELDVAARLLRRAPGRAETLLAAMAPRRGRALVALLGFGEGTAGALMDPEVLALPVDLTAEEALAQVRQAADRARYNLYVLERDGRLAGVLNLRELLLAPPRTRLGDAMVRDPYRVPADASEAAVRAHPGWREVHALPVVDAGGRYLGAIRYRTLQELERGAPGGGREAGDTAAALGDLFAAGARGLLEALAGGERTRAGTGPRPRGSMTTGQTERTGGGEHGA